MRSHVILEVGVLCKDLVADFTRPIGCILAATTCNLDLVSSIDYGACDATLLLAELVREEVISGMFYAVYGYVHGQVFV